MKFTLPSLGLLAGLVSLPLSAATPLTYTDVAPILVGRCVMCHVPGGQLGEPPEGYRLDSYDETVATSDRARVIPGNALASELYRRIKGHARPRMPMNGPPFLSDADIALVAQWINDGARNHSGEVLQIDDGTRVRLHGRLSAQWILDDLELQIHSGTRFKKSPGIGSYVRVDGRVSDNGAKIVADRIRRRK